MQLNRLCAAALSGVFFLVPLAASAGSPVAPSSSKMNASEAQQRLHKANLRFIQNAGQWDHRAQFRAHSPGLTTWVTSDGFVYTYAVKSGKGQKGQNIHLTFDGGRRVQAQGVERRSIVTKFLNQGNPKGITASSYGSTIAKNVYPGIDVRTYVDGSAPRFDFLAGPGSDPSKIRLCYEGASSVVVRDNKVVLGTQIGPLVNGSLKAYQTIGGKLHTVAASFKLVGKDEVAIKLGRYDHSKAVVIDPLVYGSYYGGDDGFDEVRAVTSDSAGGTYLTGSTQASQFPSTFGPFINLVGGADGFLTKFQGDAYSHDFACYLGGSLDDYGASLAVDAFNNVWVAGRTLSTDFPGNTRHNIMFLQQTGGGIATGGQFALQYLNTANRQILSWNATPAQVQTALNAMPLLAGHVISVTAQGGNLPNGVYRIELDGSRPFPLTVNSARIAANPVDISQGLAAIIVARQGAAPPNSTQILTREGSVPLDPDPFTGIFAQFTLTFTTAGNSQTTVGIPGNATAAQVQAALAGLSNIPVATPPNVVCSGGPLNTTPVTVTFQGVFSNAPQQLLVVDNTPMIPVPIYGVTKFTDIWIMRFTPDPVTVLAPQETMMFGGDGSETLSGFAIVPDPNPQPADPVEFVFAGDITMDAGADLTGAFPGGTPGYLARYSYSAGTFTKIGTSSFYQAPGPGATIDVTGVALDAVGDAFLGGTVFYQGNYDTSVGGNPPFVTTPGVFHDAADNGRFLKNDDLFVRKYSRDGTVMMYSCLVGGNNNDVAGGTDQYLDGSRVETGSTIAIDALGNAYVTGVSTSFNYPRTRGVYGEVFNNNANVVVTKLNPDASQIVYSTNLKTTGAVLPAGIAVDSRGFAFVSGNVHFGLVFPITLPADPTSYSPGTINTTADAIDPTWSTPVPPDLPTVEPFLNVLNETATELVYGTYLGGFLDDAVYAPYVDRFNDVWVMGWTDSFRAFVGGSGTEYIDAGALPPAMISPLAFKSSGDAAGLTEVDGVLYGDLEAPGLPAPATIDVGPPFFGLGYQRDGWLVKLRVGSAAVANLTFNPSTIAGGLGSTSTGTVTLTDPAPPGGADIELDLTDTSGGSFSADPNNPVGTEVVTVPEGTTSVQFTFFSYPVASNTQVQCRANYQGSFKIAQLTVVPWLQSITLTPTSIVGGNNVTGRITLSQAAPQGGVTVDLLTDSPSLIVLPQNAQVTVPQGQTSVVFTVGTHGVVQATNTLVTASLLGAGQSQTLTLTQAKLISVSFNPPTVAGGSVSTGTVTFDGESGAPFDILLSLNAGTAGYSIITSNGSGTNNVDLTVPQGVRSASFTVQTAFEAVNTNRKVTATRQAQNGYLFSSVQGTLFINAVSISNLTMNPNPVTGGQPTTGTVQLNTPAPAGGAIVFLQSLNTGIATLPPSVTVPAGSSSANFTINTIAQSADATVVIRANRGGGSPNVDRTLSVLTQHFTLTVTPGTVVGGLQNATGHITLSAPAPGGLGLDIYLFSNNTLAATVPVKVNLTSVTSATFPITTFNVTSTKTVTITGHAGAPGSSNTSSATLTVKPLGLVSIVLTPNNLRGGGTFNVTVTLDSVVNVNKTLTINWGSNGSKLIANTADNQITVPAGSNQGTKLNVLTKHVSRTLSTSVSITLNGKTVAATLTVRP